MRGNRPARAVSDGPAAGEGETASAVTARHAVAALSLTAMAAPMALLGYVTLALVTGVLPVGAAWLTKTLVDGLIAGEPSGHTAAAAGLALLGAVAATAPHLNQCLRAALEREVGLLTQDRLFRAVERFTGLAPFEDPRFLDRLRLAHQVGGTAPCRAVDGAIGGLQAGITVLGFLGSLFLLGPLMAALVLTAGLPTLAAEIALSRRRARMLWDIGPVERREFFYSHLLASVEAAKEVRLFGTGGFLRGRMMAERRRANAARRTVERREATTQSLLGLLAASVAGAGLLWAVAAAARGSLSVGSVAMFTAAVAGIQGSLATLAGEVARTHQSLLLFDHHLAVTTAAPDLPVPDRPVPLPALREGIELRDVWFRYSDDHPWVLRGVTVRIPRNTSLALVGLNGAGKSTLVKLLCRFYDPTRGQILWDGVDIRDVDPALLRRRIGAVFQDYMQYDMSAADNIGLGDLSAFDDRGRILTAARTAGIHDVLAGLPCGYDTLLTRLFFAEADAADSATGVELSGGQWQRLALARALLRDRRDLMILDEPSSGLDAEAEHEIHRSLRKHREGHTSLLISHRLGAVREADLIVVLADGRVVEQGDHDALMAAGGAYARLFTLQASGYRTGPAIPAPAGGRP
ncbi:ABC transporter ATP-binding protein [Streptomyces sp. GMY02]|uniref:ABC transporter ATP-binding protein n=1 Tax=Streptomyces sp. GMY02 TaxID=1333528 RepID=UPI00349F0A6B